MISVLIVDDSALMRKILSDILSSDHDIRVIGTAMNGLIAIERVKKLNPDVVTMDLRMPEMDGISAIKAIMKECPVPIIIVSAYTKEDSKEAIEGMEAGAVDFIQKPSGEISKDIELIKEQIINKVRTAAGAKVKKLEIAAPPAQDFTSAKKDKILVIGASTGGPQTLEYLLIGFPKNFPVPILIAQHMPPEFTKTFASRLNQICYIDVKEAEEGDTIKEGCALIAPGGFHMVLEKEKEKSKSRIKLIKDDAGELGPKPSVNMLFRSAAKIFEKNTIGVILTGMGKDGTDGCREIKRFEGTVIAESEESCVIYGMPKSVIDERLADDIVTLEKMAGRIISAIEM